MEILFNLMLNFFCRIPNMVSAIILKFNNSNDGKILLSVLVTIDKVWTGE
jgi:hypothetical protein